MCQSNIVQSQILFSPNNMILDSFYPQLLLFRERESDGTQGCNTLFQKENFPIHETVAVTRINPITYYL